MYQNFTILVVGGMVKSISCPENTDPTDRADGQHVHGGPPSFHVQAYPPSVCVMGIEPGTQIEATNNEGLWGVTKVVGTQFSPIVPRPREHGQKRREIGLAKRERMYQQLQWNHMAMAHQTIPNDPLSRKTLIYTENLGLPLALITYSMVV